MPIDASPRYRLLYDLGRAFAEHIELEQLLPVVIAKCRDALAAEGASVLLYDGEREELYFPYVVGKDDTVSARLHEIRFPASEGIAGLGLRAERPLKVDDATADARLFREVDRLTGVTTRSLIAAPLRGRSGPIGVLEVVNRRDGNAFAEEDVSFLESLALAIAVAVENAQRYTEVKESEEILRAEVDALRRDIARRDRFEEIVGTSPAMAEVFRLMESAAASPISVLILGETGTGKELVARGIHRASERATGPFLPVNCAALPETLLESELFGHKRGAFTGALQDRRGLFEAANGGTVFLDEVGEMPAVMQAKLLRVLQEGEVVPVGENRPRKVDVRVISATNRDLAGEVDSKTFREDLFYRLSQFPIHLPPLRARREDIPAIASLILAKSAARHRKTVPAISSDALAALCRYEWRGNVRQLQNEIERAVALVRSGEPIGRAHLSLALIGEAAPSEVVATPEVPEHRAPGQASSAVVSATTADRSQVATTSGSGAIADPTVDPIATAGLAARQDPNRLSLREARQLFERTFIVEILRQERGNVTRSAKVLGLSRVMLHQKMRDFGLR